MNATRARAVDAPLALTEFDENDPIPFVLTERAEARLMLDELARVLRRTGRYNVSDLARRCADRGHPISRETVSRWLNGAATPRTITPVEVLADIAGVDRGYLVGGAR